MPDQIVPATGLVLRRGPRGLRGQIGATGATGAQGDAGPGGSGTIAGTTNLIMGDGVDAGIDSTIDPADVIALVANNTGTNTGDQTDVEGNAATVTTIPTLTGDISNSGNVTAVANVPAVATHEIDVLSVPTNTGGWTEYIVTTNDAYTGQTLQDIAELVSDTLSPSSRYELEAKLLFSMSADNTGMKVGVSGSGSGSAATVMLLMNATANTATSGVTFTLPVVDAATNAFLTVISGLGIVTMRGFMTTRSGGSPTISIQHLKVTSGTVTCLPGSTMRLRKCAA